MCAFGARNAIWMRRNAKTDLSSEVYADEMQGKAPDQGMGCRAGVHPLYGAPANSAVRTRGMLLRSQFRVAETRRSLIDGASAASVVDCPKK